MSKSILDRNISLNPDAAEDLIQGINSLHCNGQGVFEGTIGLLNTVNGICGEIPSKALESGLVASIESLIGKLKSYSCMSIGQGITSLIQSLEERIVAVEESSSRSIKECCEFWGNSVIDARTGRNPNSLLNSSGFSKYDTNLNNCYDEFCLNYIRQNVPDILEVAYVPGMPGYDVEQRKRILEEKCISSLQSELEKHVQIEIIRTYFMASGVPAEITDRYKQIIDKEMRNVLCCRENDGSFVGFKYDKEEGDYENIHREYLVNVEITDDDFNGDVERFIKKYKENYDEYEMVSQATGVPVELVAAIHFREGSGNINKSIEDGHMLSDSNKFVSDAIRVLNMKQEEKGININQKSSFITQLTFAERYNGTGYTDFHNIASPYVYSGTNLYISGKYVIDGGFDKNAVDQQPGVYVMLMVLNEMEE